MLRSDGNNLSIGKNILRAAVPAALYLAMGMALSLLAAILTGWILSGAGLELSYEETLVYLEIPVTAVNSLIAIYLFQWMYRRDEFVRRLNREISESNKSLTDQDATIDLQRILLNGNQAKKSHVPDYKWLILLGISSCVLLNYMLNLLNLSESIKEYKEGIGTIFNMPIWVQLLVTALITPVAEEMVFRGCIFLRLREWLNKWPAIIITSLAFGFYHGNLIQGIYAFLMSILMCIVLERYGTVLAPILFHIIANITAIVMSGTGFLDFCVDHVVYGVGIGGIVTILVIFCLRKIV